VYSAFCIIGNLANDAYTITTALVFLISSSVMEQAHVHVMQKRKNMKRV